MLFFLFILLIVGYDITVPEVLDTGDAHFLEFQYLIHMVCSAHTPIMHALYNTETIVS